MSNQKLEPQKSIKATNTAHLFTLAKELEHEGKSVLHLELGDPEFHVPDVIKQKIQSEIEANNTKYEISQGTPELREAIASYYKRKFDVKIDAKKEIIISSGAKLGINFSLGSILKQDDEVIVLTPCWPTYKSITKSIGGRVKEVSINFNEQDDMNLLEQSITEKTRCVLINFPNNPTSIMVNFSYLSKLHDLVSKYSNIYLISDEIYLELAYEEQNGSMIKFFESNKRIILVSGFSKAWAMTGFRLGYVIAASEIITKIKEQIINTTSCAPPFIQQAGITAMSTTDHLENLRLRYKERSKKVVSLLKEYDIVSVPFQPNASFYIFIELKNPSENFVIDLLYKHGICVTPGGIFGEKFQNFIRVSLTNTDKVILEAIKTIMEFLKEINEK